MPDWSYHTFVRPIFRGMPDDVARRFAVGCLGTIVRLPQGFRIVDMLGHMLPDTSVSQIVGAVSCPSPLGLSPVIDPEGCALSAWARFGFGFLVVGPVGLDPPSVPLRFDRDDETRGVRAHGSHSIGLARARELSIDTPGSVRLFFELAVAEGSAAEVSRVGSELIEGLGDRADGFVLSPRSFATLDALKVDERHEMLARWSELATKNNALFFVGVPTTWDPSSSQGVAEIFASDVGLYVSGRATDGKSNSWSWDAGDFERVKAILKWTRARDASVRIAVDGSVLSPREALELQDAGADLLLLGTGLVHSGPGLAKRVNEALEYRHRGSLTTDVHAKLPHERRAWFWGALLGTSMLIGAILAAWIALTSVLLPYDEDFVGRTRAEIEAFNPRIVHFMTHDRITLAGTMVSLSILYLALSIFGMRKGQHFAQRVVSISAGLGFLSFFAFLGFGYFDPFHAFVTLLLLQFFIQLLVQPLGATREFSSPPLLDNDRAWRWSQWGQLLFVVQAVGLIVAGATILFFGMTSVFVPEDIGYLKVEPHAIASFDSELTPLIAHDRATFGGMLISAGVGLLLTTLWAFRRDDRWLWWTYLLTILPPYLMTLWIHAHIGYTDQFHLSPVYIGIALLVAGLAFSAPHLLGGHPALEKRPSSESS